MYDAAGVGGTGNHGAYRMTTMMDDVESEPMHVVKIIKYQTQV